MKFLTFIIGLIVFTSIVSASGNLYFSLIIDYDNGKLSNKEIKLIQSQEVIDLSKKLGQYKVVIKSFNNELLFETKFDIVTQLMPAALEEWFDDKGNQIKISEKELETELKKSSAVIFLPYFKNGAKIEIYDTGNKLVLTVNISQYSICNLNKICDLKESKEVCPEDCTTINTYEPISFWQWLLNLIKSIWS